LLGPRRQEYCGDGRDQRGGVVTRRSRTEVVMGTAADTAIDVRPFRVETPEEQL
jgi:hypothetical protein